MNKPIVAWSHSALQAFETCPKQYYHLKIKKDFQEEFGEEANYGTQAHKHFEDRLLKGKALPMDLQHHEKVLAKILAASGTQFGEQKLAINNSFEPTGFFDKDCYARAIIDYMKINGKKCIIIDWKFGKMKEDDAQLKLFIAFLAIFQPQIEEFTAMFYWAKEKKFVPMKVTKAELPQLWNGIIPRVKHLEEAIKTSEFPAKPSGLCKKWCVVTSCVHNGRG